MHRRDGRRTIPCGGVSVERERGTTAERNQGRLPSPSAPEASPAEMKDRLRKAAPQIKDPTKRSYALRNLACKSDSTCLMAAQQQSGPTANSAPCRFQQRGSGDRSSVPARLVLHVGIE